MHKYYISITHIKYSKKNATLQITMRLFIDDLQTELNQQNNTNIELATDREPKKIDSIYLRYICENLFIEVNNKVKKISFLGKEYENDKVIFYIETEQLKEVKNIQIKNTLLYTSFDKQENIIKLNINKEQKTFILTKNKTIAFINY